MMKMIMIMMTTVIFLSFFTRATHTSTVFAVERMAVCLSVRRRYCDLSLVFTCA